MIFSLEALRAQHGDCLMLHFGEHGTRAGDIEFARDGLIYRVDIPVAAA